MSLTPFANTEQQETVVRAIEGGATHRQVAEALGLSLKSVERTMWRVRQNAAKAGYSPECGLTKPIPAGHVLKGMSKLTHDDNGDLVWLKTDARATEQAAAMRAAVEEFKADLPVLAPETAPHVVIGDELVNLYCLTDYHLGMLSWGEETGEDWDTEIAVNLLVKWFRAAIDSAPAAGTAIYCNLGDFLHWDGYDAVTPAHRNILDADTRFQNLVRAAIRVQRQIIRMLLQKYPKVHMIIADANHDPASGAWQREMFASVYENEPRITVDNSADTYYAFEHGKTSLFFHHGHKRKPENIDDVFAAKFREVFGRTKHSYAHMGHLHNDKVLETNLMKVEQHRTLAAADAYASRGGWMSGRSAKVITYHKEHGEVGRITLSPEMVGL